jgi:hypothetical protein
MAKVVTHLTLPLLQPTDWLATAAVVGQSDRKVDGHLILYRYIDHLQLT